MSLTINIVASVIFILLVFIIVVLIFFKPGAQGNQGPAGAPGAKGKLAPQDNLNFNQIFNLANARICDIQGFRFYSPGINYVNTNIVGEVEAPNLTRVLSINYDRLGPSTFIFGVTNAADSNLHLNLIGYSDLRGNLFSNYRPSLPNGGCNSSVITDNFAPYFLAPKTSALFIVSGSQITWS